MSQSLHDRFWHTQTSPYCLRERRYSDGWEVYSLVGGMVALQTRMPVVDVAVASGFLSHAHFTKRYRQEFGYPPTLARQHAF